MRLLAGWGLTLCESYRSHTVSPYRSTAPLDAGRTIAGVQRTGIVPPFFGSSCAATNTPPPIIDPRDRPLPPPPPPSPLPPFPAPPSPSKLPGYVVVLACTLGAALLCGCALLGALWRHERRAKRKIPKLPISKAVGPHGATRWDMLYALRDLPRRDALLVAHRASPPSVGERSATIPLEEEGRSGGSGREEGGLRTQGSGGGWRAFVAQSGEVVLGEKRGSGGFATGAPRPPPPLRCPLHIAPCAHLSDAPHPKQCTPRSGGARPWVRAPHCDSRFAACFNRG